MAFRRKTALAAILMLASAAAAAPSFDARHEHWRKGCPGRLTVDATGVSFAELRGRPRKKPHAWHWPYHEIQQATLGRDTLRILTYEDSALRLGADRAYSFSLAPGNSFASLREALRLHLDTRLVVTDPPEQEPAWAAPAKLLRLTTGTHGTLEFHEDAVVFRARQPGRGRQWRLADIDNVTSTDAYSLTLTTFERSRLHYGGRRDFQFQLKQPIDPARVESLWRRIRGRREAHILDHYQKRENPSSCEPF
jgi:hypothetical protein